MSVKTKINVEKETLDRLSLVLGDWVSGAEIVTAIGEDYIEVSGLGKNYGTALYHMWSDGTGIKVIQESSLIPWYYEVCTECRTRECEVCRELCCPSGYELTKYSQAGDTIEYRGTEYLVREIRLNDISLEKVNS